MDKAALLHHCSGNCASDVNECGQELETLDAHGEHLVSRGMHCSSGSVVCEGPLTTRRPVCNLLVRVSPSMMLDTTCGFTCSRVSIFFGRVTKGYFIVGFLTNWRSEPTVSLCVPGELGRSFPKRLSVCPLNTNTNTGCAAVAPTSRAGVEETMLALHQQRAMARVFST